MRPSLHPPRSHSFVGMARERGAMPRAEQILCLCIPWNFGGDTHHIQPWEIGRRAPTPPGRTRLPTVLNRIQSKGPEVELVRFHRHASVTTTLVGGPSAAATILCVLSSCMGSKPTKPMPLCDVAVVVFSGLPSGPLQRVKLLTPIS